jgi:DNA-binding CsgD family transcriptional regulator
LFFVNITEHKKSEEKLKEAIKEIEFSLGKRTLENEKTNAALKVMLCKCEDEHRSIEARMLFNAKSLILPCIQKLKHPSMPKPLKPIVQAIEENLNNLVSPFASRLAYQFMGLTPTEIQVAELVRQGWPTKDISQLLGLSARTIQNHRKHIRTKIGLSNKKVNLRAYLLSIESAEFENANMPAAEHHFLKEILDLNTRLKKQQHRLKRDVSLKFRQLKEARRRLEGGIKGGGAETTGKPLLDASPSAKASSDYLELNLAFSELLRQRENDLQELEERIVANLRTLIGPALSRLRSSRLSASQKKWLAAIESHLNGIVSPLTTRLSSNAYGLKGKSSKEIAGLTGTSIRTVQVHRAHIRRKLKLNRQGANLKVFLQTMK